MSFDLDAEPAADGSFAAEPGTSAGAMNFDAPNGQKSMKLESTPSEWR
jgi:hypothetical protein